MAWTHSSRLKAIEAKKNGKAKNQFAYGKSVSDETKEKLRQSGVGRKHPEETKRKCSESQKQWLKNNPNKHPWRKRDKFKSKPCERLKEYLTSKGIHFVEEWIPLEDRNFSIDIAFPDIKLGIDVNGNQHYNGDGTLKPYYQERHNLIVSDGWTLIELHYSTCFNPEMIDKILEIKEQPDYSKFFEIKKERENKKLENKVLPRGQKQTIKYEKEQIPKIEMVRQANIDFTKFGWVAKLSKVIGICPQKSSKWLSRFMPEVYEIARKSQQVAGSIPARDAI